MHSFVTVLAALQNHNIIRLQNFLNESLIQLCGITLEIFRVIVCSKQFQNLNSIIVTQISFVSIYCKWHNT